MGGRAGCLRDMGHRPGSQPCQGGVPPGVDRGPQTQQLGTSGSAVTPVGGRSWKCSLRRISTEPSFQTQDLGTVSRMGTVAPKLARSLNWIPFVLPNTGPCSLTPACLPPLPTTSSPSSPQGPSLPVPLCLTELLLAGKKIRKKQMTEEK